MKKLFYILLFVPVVLFGQENYSLSFDGVDDKILIESQSNDFNLMEISIVVKVKWGGPHGTYQNIGDKLPGINSGYGLQVYNSGMIGWEFANGTNYVSVTGGQLVENEWTSIASTYDGEALKLYINGVLINEISYSFQLISNNSPLSIGHRHTSVNEYFKGQIDDVSIFDKALTQDEIQSYMNCSPSGSEDGLVGLWNFNEGSENSLYDSSGNGNHGVIFGANYIEDAPEIVSEENDNSIVEVENEFNSVLLALQSNFNIELLDDITPINQSLVYQNNSTDDVLFELDLAQYYLLNIEGSATLCGGSGWCNWDAIYEFHQDGSSFNNILDFTNYTSIFPTRLYYLVPENFSALDTSYTINHDYWFILSGEQLFFSFHDADGSYGNNQGMLNFNLYALPQSYINNLLVGCKNPDAINFDENANIDDEESCIYSQDYVHGLWNEVDDGLIQYNESVESLSSLQQALDTWNTTIDLSAGWNMFGYGCPISIDVADGLSNHTERIIITKDNNGNVYMPEFGFNGIGDFTPGFGYQIKLTEAIEGFSLCDWYVNNIPEDNIISLQDYIVQLEDSLDNINIQVGSYALGGIVFYVDETGQHGLVAATEDLPETYQWGCYGQSFEGANGQLIGAGNQNTLDIINQGCTTQNGDITAAEAVVDAEINGYSDWYLPAKEELNELFNSIGVQCSSHFEGDFYWSSSQYSNNNYRVWGFNVNSNNLEEIDKDLPSVSARPIRSF